MTNWTSLKYWNDNSLFLLYYWWPICICMSPLSLSHSFNNSSWNGHNIARGYEEIF